jgi:dipeptidyl aminopeptidase/acylaminoacyl peptidase
MTAAQLPWLPASSGQSVPEAITAEGVPSVPADLARALARYQNTRLASFQGWLADRREVLITTRFADTNQVHLVAFPGGDRSQLTFLSERVLAADPRPGGRDQFLFVADQGGAENYQLFFDDLKAGAIVRLTDGKSRHVAASWSNSGSLLAYSSNARNGTDMDVYVVDPATPASARRIKEVSGDWSVADWSPDDRRVAAVERISIHESYVHLIDVATGQTETVTPRQSPGAATVAYSDVRFAKDGRALYWTTDLGSEFRRLARYDIAAKSSTVLTGEIPWDVEGFDLSDDGGTAALTANEDGVSRLHVLDLRTRQERPAPRLPAGQISGLGFRKGSQEFGFSLSSARSTGDVYSVDLASGQLTRWTRSETGGLRTETFSEPTLAHYPTFDGRQIPVFVYQPDPARFPGKRPVVINIHGGPEGQFRPGFLGRQNYLIDGLGAAVVFPNVRGSSGYGKTYLKLDNGMLREDAVKDIGALLDWIATRPDLDATRIAVVGGSYGGYMTLASLTHYSDRLKAGIDVVGVSNFVTLLQSTSPYRRDLRRVEYGDERDPAMRAHLTKISPLTNASKIKVPLLVVAGKNDPRVPVTESEQIAAAVRKNGLPVWYIVARNEGHGFARKENQDYLQYAELLFLKQFLLGEKG